ncbi:hypothetical protein F5Y17DRAFT_192491 [Xylariaceae sp. FL0594]|nr:hypothetical protein F5Y17DRAFT_192491 [Xylariaceae sp. FL0594]
MSIDIQQYMMVESAAEQIKEMPKKKKKNQREIQRYLTPLREKTQHKFWHQMAKGDRDEMRKKVADTGDYSIDLLNVLQTLCSIWPKEWARRRAKQDFCLNYLRDQQAADEVWTLVDEDVFIATDTENNTAFANIEGLADILRGPGCQDVLLRAIAGAKCTGGQTVTVAVLPAGRSVGL